MELKQAQEKVDQWIQQHGVRYFNELTNMAQLTEEVGEVARIIARRYGEQSEKASDKSKDLGEELADVLFVLLCLANQTEVDLQAAFDRKLALKTKRDHDRHHNNPKLNAPNSGPVPSNIPRQFANVSSPLPGPRVNLTVCLFYRPCTLSSPSPIYRIPMIRRSCKKP